MQKSHALIALNKSLREFRARLSASAKGARLAPGKLRVPREGDEISQVFLLEKAAELGPIFKVWPIVSRGSAVRTHQSL